MQEDYKLLGIPLAKWKRLRKTCCKDLNIPEDIGALELFRVIKKRTGWQSDQVMKTLRKFYLQARRRNRNAVGLYQRWDNRKAKPQPIGEPHPDYKKDEGFYKSRAWRELRLLALSNCRVCQACGARPPDVVLHVDHVQPRYKAPHLALSLENLQVLCEDCNIGKGAWSMADFRGHFGSI